MQSLVSLALFLDAGWILKANKSMVCSVAIRDQNWDRLLVLCSDILFRVHWLLGHLVVANLAPLLSLLLSQACVTGMMDIWQLQQRIAQLQADKDHLERTNDAFRRESVDHDSERRGLLNLLDDGKAQLGQLEQLYADEVKRRKVRWHDLTPLFLSLSAL